MATTFISITWFGFIARVVSLFSTGKFLMGQGLVWIPVDAKFLGLREILIFIF